MMGGGRLAIMAVLLIAGEMAGFACTRVAAAWPWAVAVVVLLALAGYGWHVPHLPPVLVFIFGMTVAARMDALRVTALEGHWRTGTGGRLPVLSLPVEGEVRVRVCARGGQVADFLSHLGPVPLKVVLPLADGARIPRTGERWRCGGWISRKTLREGRFSRRMFWGRRGADHVLESSIPDSVRRLKALSDGCAECAGIGLGWCPRYAALNRAILLGRRTELPADWRRTFSAAGTVHVFAISGLHVMLIAALLMRLLVLLRIPVRLRGLVAVPLLIVYVLVTGARPSAVRAVAMAGLYLTAPAFGRKGDSLAAWSLTALGVYAYAPERLFDTGCTLSFAVMFGIVYWLRWVAPALPVCAREGWYGECGISVAAWAAGVPIVARLIGSFAPGGLFANLVVLRLAGYAVAFGMAGIVCGFVLPPVAVAFNNLAAAMTFLMVQVSKAVASVPFSSFVVEYWPLTASIGWYAAWLAAFAAMRAAIARYGGVWWTPRLPTWRHMGQ